MGAPGLPWHGGERLQLQAVKSPPPVLLFSEPPPSTADHVLQEEVRKTGYRGENCGDTTHRHYRAKTIMAHVIN